MKDDEKNALISHKIPSIMYFIDRTNFGGWPKGV